MSGDSNEVKIARMEERLTSVLRELEQARDGRKQQYETLEAINHALLQIETRVRGVEDGLTKASPTIDEFLIIKHKVAGAGVLGKWAYAGAAALITLIATSREALFAWLSK